MRHSLTTRSFRGLSLLLGLALLLLPFRGRAQELQCAVSVSAQRIQGTNRAVFEQMQRTLYEWVNQTQWSSHTFAVEERIECSFILTINEQMASDRFKGTLSVQLRRPVWGTTYNAPLLNFVDEEVEFRYIEGQPLTWVEGSFSDNLTALFAYWAYIVLGYDYDSFSSLGGQEFFDKAYRIVQQAQNASEPGWRAYGKNRLNRYRLAESMVSAKYKPLRRAMYLYHRKGLDMMPDRPVEARGQILAGILEIQKIVRARPDAEMMPITLFLNAKREEMIQIFTDAPSSEKARAVNALSEIDPINADRYSSITSQSQTRQ